jgi:hypothetical protein
MYRGVLLEVSSLSRDQLQSPEQILGNYHMAGSFRKPGIIFDPSGELARMQAVVSKEYARRRWVLARCEHARDRVLQNTLEEGAPLHDQVATWAFTAGIVTHVLLVAGLKNPTVRKRYLAVRALLDEYQRLDSYPALLAQLGCELLSRPQVERHLDRLAGVFDAAKGWIKTPFFFAADISDGARPVVVEGSRELIERGDHREAMFWIIATHCRCQKVLFHDAPPAVQAQHLPAFQDMLAELGAASSADLQRRMREIQASMPRVWELALAIMSANPDIEE